MLFKRMKKLPVLLLAGLLLGSAFAFVIAACGGDDVGGTSNANPVLDDFTIGTLVFTYDGTAKTVNITPKEGKSQGAITVHYEGTQGTSFAKTHLNGPTDAGTYAVTFDVAAVSGWNAVSGLPAGTLTIGSNIPVATDFDISGLSAIVGDTVNVTITPQANKSQGTITVYYEGIDPTVYNKNTEAPSALGSYTVTFDVAAAAPFNEATGLNAGTLVISEQSETAEFPVVGDFTIGTLVFTYDGNPKEVSISPKTDKSAGAITVYYDESITAPTNAGTYAVTFDVAAAYGWNQAPGLSAGNLVINPATPLPEDFNITGLPAEITVGGSFTVSITPKEGKSTGAIIIYYAGTGDTEYSKSETKPTAAGTYAVTFDVAAAANYNVASGLSAGLLTIEAEIEATTDYITTLNWGISSQANVLTLGLQPGNTTASINLNWYSSSGTSGKVAQVRFVRGTFTAGYELFTPTGTATAAGSSTAHKATVTGLIPGASYQYAVSSNGTDWSEAYDFKVPAATGPFKFAVIADPQLHVSTWDSLNRYNPQANTTGQYVPSVSTKTTGAGWLETMVKIVNAGVSFIASGGDQVDASSGNETEYNLFFNPPGLRNLPFAPVSGNHDNHLNFNYHYNVPNIQDSGATGTEAGRNYYYKYNNILFVVLDTAPYPGSQSAAAPYIARYRAALVAATTAHPTYDWLIVQHHKSTASVADHCADRDIQYYVEAGFETLMSEFDVDFVLAGHDHVYARSYPLAGRDGGKVSVPNTAFNPASGSTWHNPGAPVYLTFTTGSGLKYYAVAADKTSVYGNTLYVRDGVAGGANASYPYLGNITEGDGSTQYGSSAYMTGNYLPVSNAAYVQPYIPSYCIVEVNGRSITFSTYAIASVNGQVQGAAQGYSFDADVPYDSITVTKN